jgi:cytochrome c biogenesis protein CcmG/thiol:disulfide interchange protein DsbE
MRAPEVQERRNGRQMKSVMSQTVRLGVLIIGCVAVVAAALFGYAHRARLASLRIHRVVGQVNVPLVAGAPFPALDLVAPDGQRVRYAPAPGRISVINVFATWCPPCQAESPAYATFAKSAAQRGILVVGIDRAESAQKVEAYRRAYGLSFPYFIDNGDTTKDVLGARAMPVTIVVDARGIIRADVAGPVTVERLEALSAQAANL